MKSRVTRAKPHRITRNRSRRPTFAKFIRVLTSVLLVSGILFGVGAVVAKAARPYLISYGESREIADINRQIAQAEAENNALRHNINHLTDPKTQPRAMEAEARKLGWVKQGEVALIIEQPKSAVNEAERNIGGSGKSSFWRTAGWRMLKLFVRTNSAH